MRTHTRLFAIIGLALACAGATPPAAVRAAAKPPANAAARHPLFLWRATGGRGTVYLLGSIHVGMPDLYPLPRPIERDFRKSTVLVEEIDLAKTNPARFARLTAESGFYPAGDSLERHVSPVTQRALAKFLKRTGENPAVFSRMKPWLASLVITTSAVAPSGAIGRYGIDEHFAREAKAAHKETGQLESLGFQIRLLSSLSPRLQDAMLRSSLSDAKKAQADFAKLLRVWKSGNAAEMERLITRDTRKHPRLKRLFDKLLPARNIAMAQKIEGYLATPTTTFVVVGAGHLIGPHGIVALLRAKHLTVRRIDSR